MQKLCSIYSIDIVAKFHSFIVTLFNVYYFKIVPRILSLLENNLVIILRYETMLGQLTAWKYYYYLVLNFDKVEIQATLLV